MGYARALVGIAMLMVLGASTCETVNDLDETPPSVNWDCTCTVDCPNMTEDIRTTKTYQYRYESDAESRAEFDCETYSCGTGVGGPDCEGCSCTQQLRPDASVPPVDAAVDGALDDALPDAEL